MNTSDQYQTASHSIVEGAINAMATGSWSHASAKQPDSVCTETQGSADAADVKEVTAEKKVLLLEQQLEQTKEQSQEHEEHARYISHLASCLSLLMCSSLLFDLLHHLC